LRNAGQHGVLAFAQQTSRKTDGEANHSELVVKQSSKD
jgi:hypothetical protein